MRNNKALRPATFAPQALGWSDQSTGAVIRRWAASKSLIEHRASVEGSDSPVPPDLLRLSVGIEDPDDLIADLEAAFRGLAASSR
jgi:hypothetical protein